MYEVLVGTDTTRLFISTLNRTLPRKPMRLTKIWIVSNTLIQSFDVGAKRMPVTDLVPLLDLCNINDKCAKLGPEHVLTTLISVNKNLGVLMQYQQKSDPFNLFLKKSIESGSSNSI